MEELGSIKNLRCGCVIIKEGNIISLGMSIKDSDADIPSFSVMYRFEFYPLASYPLIRLYLELFSPKHKDPLKSEALFDVAKDKVFISILARQPSLNLHFFNPQGLYISSKEIPFFPSQREILEEVIKEAETQLSFIPESQRNIDISLMDFYASYPL
jgi:hypothetical protein